MCTLRDLPTQALSYIKKKKKITLLSKLPPGLMDMPHTATGHHCGDKTVGLLAGLQTPSATVTGEEVMAKWSHGSLALSLGNQENCRADTSAHTWARVPDFFSLPLNFAHFYPGTIHKHRLYSRPVPDQYKVGCGYSLQAKVILSSPKFWRRSLFVSF